MKTDFVLLDLDWHGEHFCQYVKGWTEQEILGLLAMRGTLRHVEHPKDDRIYFSISSVGIHTGFRISEAANLVILYNHTTRVVKDIE